jgi:hypothetical protein
MLLEAKRQQQLCMQPDKVDALSGQSVLRTVCVAETRFGSEKEQPIIIFITGMKNQFWNLNLVCDIWEA